MLEPKVWELSSRVYVHNTQVDGFAHINGNYVVVPNFVFDKTNEFQQIFLSGDFDFWDSRDVTVFENQITNTEMIGYNDSFIMTGSMTKDDGTYFVALSSSNGFDWIITFLSNIPSTSYTPNKMTKYGGTVFSLCKGIFFVGIDNQWTNYRLPDEYKDFDIVDNCYKDGYFYFLCKTQTTSVIVVTDSYMSFSKVINIDNDVNPFAIETDTNIIIIVGRDKGNNGVISVLDDSDTWETLTLIHTTTITDACTFYDVIYCNEEWTVVGMSERTGNGFIPINCLCYRFNSDILTTNLFVQDENSMKSLQRVEIYNGYLYAYGGVTNQGGYVCRRLA